MRLRLDSRPRNPRRLHLHLSVQILRGRTHTHCRSFRSRPHSVTEPVWHLSDTHPWSQVKPDWKKLLQTVRVTSQVNCGYDGRWHSGNQPYSIWDGNENSDDGEDDGHEPRYAGPQTRILDKLPPFRQIRHRFTSLQTHYRTISPVHEEEHALPPQQLEQD